MIKNVALKKVLKASVFKAASALNKIIPKDDKLVMLYSANKGIQHSLVPLKKYLLSNGFQNRYHIVCGIENMKYAEKDEGIVYVSRMKAYLKFFKAKHVFYTTGQVPIKPSKDQCVIHLRHGNTNFKRMGKLTNINNGDEFFFTYMAASSSLFKPIMSKEYGCKEDDIAVVGDPIIDPLFEKPSNLYDFTGYSKLILWLPTFRQSDYLGYDDSVIEDLVPMFKETEYLELNELLKQNNIKLIVKIHPSQRNIGCGKRHYSNFDVYTNDEFINAGYELYPFMARADALIGDYSSASMQFLVLDRPQAFVVPDINEYKEKRGFIFDDPEKYMGGHIIKVKEQFKEFINDMAQNLDPYADKRRKVCNEVYQYKDNHNCERVVNLSGLH